MLCIHRHSLSILLSFLFLLNYLAAICCSSLGVAYPIFPVLLSQHSIEQIPVLKRAERCPLWCSRSVFYCCNMLVLIIFLCSEQMYKLQATASRLIVCRCGVILWFDYVYDSTKALLDWWLTNCLNYLLSFKLIRNLLLVMKFHFYTSWVCVWCVH